MRLQVAFDLIAVMVTAVCVASLAGLHTPFAKIEGNEVPFILFSLVYLARREDKLERKADKLERKADKEEMASIRREDKEEMASIRREDKEEMVAMRKDMSTTSTITILVSLLGAVSSAVYTYFSINHK
jgi:hypothetical protein